MKQEKLNNLNPNSTGSSFLNWINNNFIKQYDKYVFARSFILFSFLAFFMGNNLAIYLWLYVSISIYLLILRIIRFWTKRNLLYLVEFCYFGNIFLLIYIIRVGDNLNIFKLVFMVCSGVIAFAAIALNNQAQFNSTDHLTSSFIHIFPMITCWLIRWREKIYSKSIELNLYGLKSVDMSIIEFGINNEFWKLIYLPLLFWFGWAIFYSIMVYFVLKNYFNNPIYWNAINDFKKFKNKLTILLFGNLNKFTVLKYLAQHFLLFVISLIFPIISFYSFIFNTIFICFMILFLAFNTSRNNLVHIKKAMIVDLEKNIIQDINQTGS